MKQAVVLMGRPKSFKPPSGIQTAQVDSVSGQLATPECPNARSEIFITGTEPVEFCNRHGSPVVVTTSTASVHEVDLRQRASMETRVLPQNVAQGR